jgi:hypothetical protein
MMFDLADTDGSQAAGVLDLRGSGSRAAHGVGVLEDPSGRRRVHMRRIGRASGAFFSVWLSALVLAGVGVIPRGVVPLAGFMPPAGDTAPTTSGRRTPQPTGATIPPHRLAAAQRPPRAVVSGKPGFTRSRAASGSRTRAAGTTRHAPRASIDRPRSGHVSIPKEHSGGAAMPAPSAAPGQTRSSPDQPTQAARNGFTPPPTAAPGQSGSTPAQPNAPGQMSSAPGQNDAPGQTGSTPAQKDAPGRTDAAPGSTAISRTDTVPAGSGQGGERSPILAAGQS